MCTQFESEEKGETRTGGRIILMGENESLKKHEDELCGCVREREKPQNNNKKKNLYTLHTVRMMEIASQCDEENEHLRKGFHFCLLRNCHEMML